MIPVRAKKPSETRTFVFEFANKLEAGESITGTPTLSVASGVTVVSGPTIQGASRVVCQLASGADGSDYAVYCEVATTALNVLRLDFILEVRLGAN